MLYISMRLQYTFFHVCAGSSSYFKVYTCPIATNEVEPTPAIAIILQDLPFRNSIIVLFFITFDFILMWGSKNYFYKHQTMLI